jgi:hypothetical protein
MAFLGIAVIGLTASPVRAEDEPTPTAPLQAPSSPEGALAPVIPEPAESVNTTASEAPPPSAPKSANAPESTPKATSEAAAPVPPQAEIPPPLDIGGNSAPDQSSTTTQAHVLAYKLERPSMGVEISSSLQALGKSPGIPNFESANVRALKLEIEYQPPFLQQYGVVGLGVSGSVYPISPRGDIADSAFSLWAVGGQIRYQARFFREQILVPMAGYSFEALTYHLADHAAGRLDITGPFFGAMLLLNPFEPSAAGDSWVDSGISRTYIVAELRSRSGTDANVSFSGSSVFLGLRFEF